MEIEKFETENILVTEVKSMDPVRIYIEDHDKGVGRIVITCYGRAYTYFWSGMGNTTMAEFFSGCNIDYLASKLDPGTNSTITDWDQVSADTGCQIDEHNAIVYSEEMEKKYGCEWFFNDDLPTKENPEWWHLYRIIKVAQEALAQGVKS